MASTLELRTNLLTLLGTLTIANGYNFDYTTDSDVTDFGDVSEYNSDSYPIVCINDVGSEQIDEELTICNASAFMVDWTIMVVPFVDEGDAERIYKSKVETDLHKLIDNNPSLLGVATLMTCQSGENSQNVLGSSPEKYIFTINIRFQREWL